MQIRLTVKSNAPQRSFCHYLFLNLPHGRPQMPFVCNGFTAGAPLVKSKLYNLVLKYVQEQYAMKNVRLPQKYNIRSKYPSIAPKTNAFYTLSSVANTYQRLTTNHGKKRCPRPEKFDFSKTILLFFGTSIRASQQKMSINLLMVQLQERLSKFLLR